MTLKYQEAPISLISNQISTILCTKNGITSVVPFDPANTDYQEYLAWLEEGNEPLPAD